MRGHCGERVGETTMPHNFTTIGTEGDPVCGRCGAVLSQISLVERLQWLLADYESLSSACENEYGGDREYYRASELAAERTVKDAIGALSAQPETGEVK